MELKEAKHILEERKSLLINSSMPDISLVTAIDTVLEELNNRILKNEITDIKRKEISRRQKIFGELNTNDILNSYTKKYTDIDMNEYAGMEVNRVLEEILNKE